MDGFKNTTKTSYDTASGRKFANGGMTVSRADMPNGEGPMSKPAMVAKYAKGGHVKKAEQKIGRVMTEFTEGKLHSGSKEGPKVDRTKQAVAIALNEARAAGAKIPHAEKAKGGKVHTYSAKAGAAGKDLGKKGKNFDKIAAKAGKEYGSKEAGERVAGAVLGKLRKRFNEGGSAEAGDALMARMTPKEMAMGAKGVRMAKERLARTEGPEPRARMIREVTEVVKPAKAVPVAPRSPMFGPARSLSIPLKKGGLSVMPKGKC